MQLKGASLDLLTPLAVTGVRCTTWCKLTSPTIESRDRLNPVPAGTYAYLHNWSQKKAPIRNVYSIVWRENTYSIVFHEHCRHCPSPIRAPIRKCQAGAGYRTACKSMFLITPAAIYRARPNWVGPQLPTILLSLLIFRPFTLYTRKSTPKNTYIHLHGQSETGFDLTEVDVLSTRLSNLPHSRTARHTFPASTTDRVTLFERNFEKTKKKAAFLRSSRGK